MQWVQKGDNQRAFDHGEAPDEVAKLLMMDDGDMGSKAAKSDWKIK